MKAAIVLAVVLAAGTARAEPRQPTRDPHPSILGVEVNAQFSITDGMNESWADDLSGYGYGSVAGGGFSIYGGYEVIPFVDLGVVGDYWGRNEGSSRGDTAEMYTDARQLGVFARLKVRHPSHRLEIAERLDLGVTHSQTSLRGQTLEEGSMYWRIRTELAAGGLRTKAVVHFSYAGQTGADDFAPFAPPKLGGLGLGIGVLHRF